MLTSILRAAGYRTGLYTSPHLVRYNERVRLPDRDATDDELVAAFNAVEDARLAARDAEGGPRSSRISNSARWPRCGCSRGANSMRWCSRWGSAGASTR